MDRRTILQTIGTGVSMGAFASPTAATPKDADPLTKLEIEAEELQSGDTRQYYTQVRTSPPGEAMEAFLREQYNPGNGQDKNPVRIEDLVGMKIAGTGIPEHIRLKAPLNSSKSEIQDYVEFRLLENGVVTAETLINDQAYKTHPVLSHPQKEFGAYSADTDNEQEIITALEWSQEIQSDAISTTSGPGCSNTWTFETSGAACLLLGGIAGVVGGTMAIFPEPGSTVVGTLAISSILSGSCGIIEGVDDIVDECNVSEITICQFQPCSYCIPQLQLWPTDCI